MHNPSVKNESHADTEKPLLERQEKSVDKYMHSPREDDSIITVNMN